MFLHMFWVEIMRSFLLTDSSEQMAVRLISAFWTQKTFDSYFLAMMCVELMKNFLLADSRELMAVRLISASWAQKRLIPSFYTCSGSSSWEIFFSPIGANRWLLDSFWPLEHKNVWFLLSRHDVRRVHEKFSSPDSSEQMAVRLISAFWTQKRLIPSFCTCSASRSWKILVTPIRTS